MAGGAALAVVEPEGWDGAAGAAGVDVVGRAGVSGTALDDEALGYDWMSSRSTAFTWTTYLVYHADHEALLLDLICLNLLFILENLAYTRVNTWNKAPRPPWSRLGHTGVDELQSLCIKALLGLDLLLHSRHL